LLLSPFCCCFDQFVRSLEAQHRCLGRLAEAFGADHPLVGDCLLRAAHCHLMLGDLAQAQENADNALKVRAYLPPYLIPIWRPI